MQRIQRISPCMWFDNQAEEAATFYSKIFPNSRIGTISRTAKRATKFTNGPRAR